MTQYRLKKETFGIPAGTIADRELDGVLLSNYVITMEGLSPNIYLPVEVVENGDEFEVVKPDTVRVSKMSDDCRYGYKVSLAAWEKFLEEEAIV